MLCRRFSTTRQRVQPSPSWGRNLAMQLIASLGADLFLGDIKGAFLESVDEKQENDPLFAHLPPGGIPGVSSEAVIMIVGNVYGKNDAPAVWYKSFDQEARAAGFERSSFDKCLYYVRDEEGKLCGVLVVHVDDTAPGGVGKHYESVVQHLRRRFPFRKWQQHKGEYNGAFYEQDPVTKTISMHQKAFAEEKLRPIRLSRSRMNNRDETATDAEISGFQRHLWGRQLVGLPVKTRSFRDGFTRFAVYATTDGGPAHRGEHDGTKSETVQ